MKNQKRLTVAFFIVFIVGFATASWQVMLPTKTTSATELVEVVKVDETKDAKNDYRRYNIVSETPLVEYELSEVVVIASVKKHYSKQQVKVPEEDKDDDLSDSQIPNIGNIECKLLKNCDSTLFVEGVQNMETFGRTLVNV